MDSRVRDRGARGAPAVRRRGRRGASAFAASGSVSSFSSAIPRSMPSATRRCCAPSWRSRSSRRRSSIDASTVLDRVSLSTCALSSSVPARGPEQAAHQPAIAGSRARARPTGRAASGSRPRETRVRAATACSSSSVSPNWAPPCGSDHAHDRQGQQAERSRPDRDHDRERHDADREHEDEVSRCPPADAVDQRPSMLGG